MGGGASSWGQGRGKNGWDGERWRRREGKFKLREWESVAIQVSRGGRNWDLQPHCSVVFGGPAEPPPLCIPREGLPGSQAQLVRDGEKGGGAPRPGLIVQPLEEERVWGEGAGGGETGRLLSSPARLSPGQLGSWGLLQRGDRLTMT